MAIYISKEAIKHNPFVTEEVNQNEKKYPPLSSELLGEVNYLVSMINRPKSVKYLKLTNPENDYLSIVRIKAALNIIHVYLDDYNGKQYEIPNGKLFNTSGINAGEFDKALEDAIIAFQNFMGINADGVIGPETVHSLDNFVHNIFFDPKKNEIIGKAFVKDVLVKKDIDENGKYSYTVRSGDKLYGFSSDSLLQVTPIIPVKSNDFAIVADPDIVRGIIFDNAITGREKEQLENTSYLHIGPFDSVITNQTISSFEDLQSDVPSMPPKRLAKEQARLYVVQPGDSPVKFIEKEYYSNEEVKLVNPFSETEEAIYNFKAQELSSDPLTREHDAKLQFYLNLIYYLNTEGEGSKLKEYGIRKADTYQRYDDNHLDEFEMFANIYDENDPLTALPNYYRFLKSQENKGSKIEFNDVGETTSFVMREGEQIYIPTREYADSLYYHLNFRHKEMLVEKADGFDYLDNTFINTAESITLKLAEIVGIADGVLQFLIKETKELLVETWEFMKKAYAYAKELAEEWPRGFGGELGGGIGATWGFLAGDIDLKSTLYRKMSKENELVIVLRQYNKGFAGVDVGVGGSFGVKVGSGKSKKISSGIQVGAGAKAGLEFTLTADYEFPIRKEETALLTLLIQVFGGVKTKLAAKLTGSLTGINLDPEQYLTYMKIGMAVKADVWGAAQVGMKKDKTDPDEKKKVIDEEKNIIVKAPEVNDKKDKSFFSFSNIWSALSGVGVAGEGQVAVGSELEYKVKYNNKPLVPEVSGRVPSEGEIKTFFFVSGQLGFEGIGSLLKRVLMSSKIAALLNFLNFETGIGLGVERKFKRNSKASEVNTNDVNILHNQENIDISAIDDNNGKARFSTENITWEKQLLLSRFTGDVDALFVAGSETTLKLNTYKLIKTLRDDDTDFFSFKTIDAILGIINSIELQFKPSIINTGREQGRLNFLNGVMDTMNKNMKKGNMRDFVTRKPSIEVAGVALEAYAGAYAKVEFKVSDLKDLIGYYIKYWYLVLKSKTLDFSDGIEEYKNKLEKEIKIIYEELGETRDAILVKKQYEELFEKLNKFIQEEIFDKESITPESFSEAALELLDISKYLLKYINSSSAVLKKSLLSNEGESNIWEGMDIQRFASALVTMAKVLECDVAFEGKIGGSYKLKIGAALGAKLRFSGLVEGGLVFVYQIMEGNQLIALESSDPGKSIISNLGKTLGVDPNTGKIGEDLRGIRKAIIPLPN